jgi:phosphate transport system permease protein
MPSQTDNSQYEFGNGVSPQIRARHRKGVVFKWLCWAATWFGVLMLAVLLFDVGVDSSGWINSRIDNDPRMFMINYVNDPEFKSAAESLDPGLFKKVESKIKSKRRTALSDGREQTAEDERQILEDSIHSEYSRDPGYLAQFGIVPDNRQRLIVFGWMIKDVLTQFPSRFPTKAGYKSALAGTFWLFGLTALLSVPIGVAAAVYLEEYAAKNRLNRFIEVNIANLAGVPSIVYGILGLAFFVRWLSLGRSVLAGAATMALVVLPVIIIASREALRAVPDSIRQGGFALGATRWQVIRHHVLPAALPGIVTGVILAMSRAIGETAPMIMIGALTFIAYMPATPMDEFTVLPIQIFNWVSMPQKEFHMLAACGILILLVVLLAMNSLAIYIRNRAERSLKW